jgi:hypothetical protein
MNNKSAKSFSKTLNRDSLSCPISKGSDLKVGGSLNLKPQTSINNKQKKPSLGQAQLIKKQPPKETTLVWKPKVETLVAKAPENLTSFEEASRRQAAVDLARQYCKTVKIDSDKAYESSNEESEQDYLLPEMSASWTNPPEDNNNVKAGKSDRPTQKDDQPRPVSKPDSVKQAIRKVVNKKKEYKVKEIGMKQLNAARSRVQYLLDNISETNHIKDDTVVLRIAGIHELFEIQQRDLRNGQFNIDKAIEEMRKRKMNPPIIDNVVIGFHNKGVPIPEIKVQVDAMIDERVKTNLEGFKINGAQETKVERIRLPFVFISIWIVMILLISHLQHIASIYDIFVLIRKIDIVTPLLNYMISTVAQWIPEFESLNTIIYVYQVIQNFQLIGFVIEYYILKRMIQFKAVLSFLYVSTNERKVVRVTNFESIEPMGLERLSLLIDQGSIDLDTDLRTDNQQRSQKKHTTKMVAARYRVRTNINDILYFEIRRRIMLYSKRPDLTGTTNYGTLINVFLHLTAPICKLLKYYLYQEKEHWKLTSNWKWMERTMIFDAELLAQVISAEVVIHTMENQMAYDRIEERAKSFSTINMNKYETIAGTTGKQIVADTALVGYTWYLEKQSQHDRSVFPRAHK